MDELLFTPAAVLSLLSQIDELKDVNVGVSEYTDGLQIQVGESIYTISSEDAEKIDVDESVLDRVDEISVDAYQGLEDSGSIEIHDPDGDGHIEEGVSGSDDEVVEGGIIKELAKTLFVGGLVRLTAKMLKK